MVDIQVHYNESTGEILGFYPDDIGYSEIPTPIIAIDNDEHQDCISNPGKRRVDLTTREIVEYTPTVTLAEVQDQAWARIKTERDKREQSGAPYLTGTLDSDSVSTQRIAIAVQAALAAKSAGTAFTLDWTMQDNSVVAMTADQVIGMATALATHSNAVHEAARTVRETIYAATDEAGVAAAEAAVVWPSTVTTE